MQNQISITYFYFLKIYIYSDKWVVKWAVCAQPAQNIPATHFWATTHQLRIQ